MSGRALLYGATGFTGRGVAAAMAEAGVEVVLAGRNADRVRRVAEPLGLAWTAFDLSSPSALDQALDGVTVVLHAAGPFEVTASPMWQACLRAGAHYLDLGGEWPVFREAMSYDAQAQAAGVMLMPGVGLTVAATDCLLAMAKAERPDAVKLRLGVAHPQVISRGTVVSAARLLSPEVIVRRGGQLVTVPAGRLTHAFDFGAGPVEATAMSWADVVTAEFSTGVPEIEVYSELPGTQRLGYRLAGMAMGVTGPGPWRATGEAIGAVWPEGPSDEARRRASFVMVAEAVDPWRRVSRVRMQTCDGYSLSVATAVAAVERVLAGSSRPGFQTPSRVFGAEFVLETGCARLLNSTRPAEALA